MLSAKRSAEVQRDPYVVKQVGKSDTPTEGEGADWYRYVIEGARTRIVGYTHGSLQQVNQIVQGYAASLNARAEGRGIYPWTPRKRW